MTDVDESSAGSDQDSINAVNGRISKLESNMAALPDQIATKIFNTLNAANKGNSRSQHEEYEEIADDYEEEYEDAMEAESKDPGAL